MEQMNYDTKSYRKRYNIPLDLKLGYRNVWAERMDSVIQMIGQGLKLKDIGNHYGCTAVNVSAALKAAGHGSIRQLGYKNVWADRMPDVINMIGQGLKLKAIGKHYGCEPRNVSAGMKAEGYSIHHVRASFRAAL